jgi:predicted peptidase
MFSKASKRPWLKAAGIYTLIIGLVLLSTIIWSMHSQDVQKNITLEKIHQWTSLVSCLIPFLYIMNFLRELKLTKSENAESPPPPQRSWENFMVIAGMIAIITTVIVGATFASESFSKLSWEKHLSIKTKEWAKLFDTRTFVGTKGNALQYQLLKPLDHDPKKLYPLVVCLPYGGGVEGSPPAQELLKDINRTKYPAFLLVPYCPPGAGWGGIPNYPTIDSLVFEAILALEKEFEEIDIKRRYVTGVSRGGYGSWHFICMQPEMFAAAVPVCGGGDINFAKNIVNVSVWAFHGEKDKNVPVSGSRDMIEAIKNAGGNPRYTEFPNKGHDIWDHVTATPGLLDWLFTQKLD